MNDRELFGELGAERVYRMTLRNDRLAVRVLTYGATLHSIETPDRQDVRRNIVLSQSTLSGYVRSPHFGAVAGRYAGRIRGATFELEGTTHRLLPNNAGHAIHGGPMGFGKRVWTLLDHSPRHVLLELLSPDGDQGYPGSLTVQCRYALDGDDLTIDYAARTDRATVINLTNHAYFNLTGEGRGDVLGHELTIPAAEYALLDAQSIPTGMLGQVAGTAFDFQAPRTIGSRIDDAHPQLALAGGYDHAYVLPRTGLRRAAVLRDPTSHRTLEVSTTETAIHLYTGNMLTGTFASPSGHPYRTRAGVCLEAQHIADSPNQPNFPSTVIRPGREYRQTTVFRLGLSC